MKVNGFLKDVTGASRVTKARRSLIQHGDPNNIYRDPIRETAKELHPEKTDVMITKVEEVSPTAKKYTFKAIISCSRVHRSLLAILRKYVMLRHSFLTLLHHSNEG